MPEYSHAGVPVDSGPGLAAARCLEAVSLKGPPVLYPHRRFALALAISLCAHTALLLVRRPSPTPSPLSVGEERSDRLNVTLAPPAAPKSSAPIANAQPTSSAPAPSQGSMRSRTRPSKQRTAPAAADRPALERPAEAEIKARRDAVAQFFEEIRPRAAPSGAQLSQQALAVARDLARGSVDEPSGERRDAPFRTPHAARILDGANPLSMDLYFEAFVQKLNRSAAFVSNEGRSRGADVAVVEIQLNADGTLRRFRILSAADQQTEIDYVRRVVARASPFAAFPPDIRRTNESLSFEICILPARASASGGFSRTFGGRSCSDLG